MAEINETGFVQTDLEEYLTRVRENWSAVFGEDLNFNPDTPQAELTAADAVLLVQLDEVLADLAASLDISQATGQQLDNLCSILSILRKGAIKSNVNADLTGSPLAVIPAGSKAKLTTGEIFVLDSSVQLDGSGEGAGFFQAEDSGPINVPVASLTQIVTPVAGWETVSNAAQGATGEDQETDFDYRRRYFLQLAVNAVTPIDSIVAGVFALDGVTDVAGFENDTSAPVTIEGISVSANSVAIAVLGGSDSEVAAEIRRRKTLGTGTVGDTTVSVPVTLPDSQIIIQNLDINFYRVEEVATLISIDITTGAKFPSNGEQLIKNALLEYFAGTSRFDPEFEYDGLQIAEDVYESRLYSPVNSVPGHIINSLSVTGAVSGVKTINLNQKATLTEDDISITTS